MKLHLHTSPLNLVTQYGDGYLDVNQTRYTENVLITPEHVAPWGRAGFDGLSAEDFAALLEYTPEVVVFGAGARLRFPHPRLTAALTNAGIGVEVMDTGAACRTYNVLLSEDRRVLAAILL
ncbi:Mth938-like domain-containing protein [Rivihabitans pingtungensis]|jgi:uncharacterized protein|uniref:Xcc1710-like domain-containing protein n=1 Tax=Rivihabitans pingtungensis TaxID=1054498 RepID=A0A318KXE9_9NEIS|nr:Mth938-like domain-containing protein [Rivihabitans pingtungensis]PXX80395.1 uncharacterized protein DFR34_104174 [Rivihabitans pingtungensis]